MKKVSVLIVMIIPLVLTGCWDHVEINDRAFVSSVGLDCCGEEYVDVVFTIPNLPVVTGQGGEGDPKFIKKTSGKTIFDATKSFNKISNLVINFDHTKIIVFGEDFINNDERIKKALDYFDRNVEYSKSLIVIATDTKAEELLMAKPNGQKITGAYISDVFEKNISGEMQYNKMELGNFIISMYETEGTSLLPVVNFIDNQLMVDGIVILDAYKKCLKLSSDETIPFSWIKGYGQGSIQVFEYERTDISYEISEIDREINFVKNEEGFEITIKISTEGDIDEFIFDTEENVNDSKKIEEIEKIIQEHMEEETNYIVKKIQKEVGKDVLQIGEKLKIQDGKTWDEIEDDWDYYFSSAEINVEVDPSIRRIGMTK